MTKEQARELGKAIVSYVFESHVLQNNGSNGMVWARNDNDFITKLSDILTDDPKPECPAKRVEYYVCYSDGTPEDLAREVNKRLADGWRPQGGISVGLRLIYQALVREVVG